MRRFFELSAIFTLAFMVAPLVDAGQLTVTWTNPTQYTDDSAIAAGEITQTRVEYGTCNAGAFGTRIGEGRASGAVTAITIPNVAPGAYCIRAFTTARGVESLASNVATATVVQPPPRPPTIVTVTPIAYRITFPQNQIALSRVGTVPLNVACNPAYTANGYYVIPRDRVRWDGAIQPSTVLGRCG